MSWKANLTVFLGLAVSVLLALPSCGPTCPEGVGDCAKASAGAAGADAGKCDQLDALEVCLNDMCNSTGRGSPYCACHDQGMDLSGSKCTCIKFNAVAFCQQANFYGYTAEYFENCPARTSQLLTMCVPVQ